jgi:hypothetical protein
MKLADFERAARIQNDLKHLRLIRPSFATDKGAVVLSLLSETGDARFLGPTGSRIEFSAKIDDMRMFMLAEIDRQEAIALAELKEIGIEE